MHRDRFRWRDLRLLPECRARGVHRSVPGRHEQHDGHAERNARWQYDGTFHFSGRMYVSCFNGTSENVTTSVFSSTTGNPAPIATYFAGEAGPALNAAGDIALATSDDENQILIFPPFLPGSSQNGGNQSPLATLSVGVNGPAGLVYH